MSNGAIAPQTTASGTFGYGSLGSQQPTSQQNPPKHKSMGSDRITAPTEVIAPPLMPNTAPDEARVDSIVKSQMTGDGAIAVAGGAIAILAMGSLPFLWEAAGKRINTQKKLQGEKFEHVIHDAHRTAELKSDDWVARWEDNNIRPFYVDALVADMKSTWEDLASSDPKVREDAELNCKALGMPIVPSEDQPRKYRLLGLKESGSFKPVPPQGGALMKTALHVHATLDAFQKDKKLDNDLARSAQEQIGVLCSEYTGESSAVDHDGLAKRRRELFQHRLNEFHHEAQLEFYRNHFRGPHADLTNLPGQLHPTVRVGGR